MSAGVLLVGASGLAREVIASGMAGIIGILDDDEGLRDAEMGGVTVVGPIAQAAAREESLLVCVGAGVGRRRIVRRLASAGVRDTRYATFVSDGARIGSTSVIGAGSIVLDGTVVTADVSIGRHVVIMPNCTITHDDVLEDYTTLAAGVALAGGVRTRQAAYLGMNAAVRQGVAVGSAAVIGMGAAVLNDVPDGQTWAGVPARRIGGAA
ncbi:NeuD/PglB/VioB family sugar acetyltransferase [Microbacterium sp. P04]|uniref:NeuD/PglB/VioB family sugar acetyltransferase n=1 Tax=Microbacterium sp. P04 TaxID=3366947 RepID=UPI0037463E10